MENFFSDLDPIDVVDAVEAVAQGYTPLPEIDPATRDFYERHRVTLLKQLEQEIVKRTAKFVAMQGLKMLTGNLADTVAKVPALVSTTRHLACLRLLFEENNYECVCNDASQNCRAIITYIINQKSKKLARTGFDMVPALSTAQSVGLKARATYKFVRGTLGQVRGYMAYDLHKKMKTCSLAEATAAELLGSIYLPKCWIKAYAVRDWDEGWKILEDKMAST
ncbi:hypothetical protein NX722_00420 [Endozoicomonas gorgoniicola]|uniref:Uncharacterized protein n=1 Tax=Endozoicomonas gorgoniicola TaxID=1234144 RepID=A0ABT3MP75_9GAMM|nr:hypothetical protein [Endozoicomonas gorgoniicola]MCW7551146.1 hypothetical protein [Endozoicomonas gorgoniicola]